MRVPATTHESMRGPKTTKLFKHLFVVERRLGVNHARGNYHRLEDRKRSSLCTVWSALLFRYAWVFSFSALAPPSPRLTE